MGYLPLGSRAVHEGLELADLERLRQRPMDAALEQLRDLSREDAAGDDELTERSG